MNDYLLMAGIIGCDFGSSSCVDLVSLALMAINLNGEVMTINPQSKTISSFTEVKVTS